MPLRGCLLCDLCAEHGQWFGFVHDRAQWADWDLRPAMARAHGLVLAEGGNLRDGPWIPWRDTARDDGEYEAEHPRGVDGRLF